MSGPPPIPAERKRKLGNPGRRPLPDLANVIALPTVRDEPPDQLGPAGRAMWDLIIGECKWLAESDRGSVVLLCEKVDRRQDLMVRLESSDFVLYTDKGYAYANPLVSMLSGIENEIVKLMSLLGLTPADRTRMGVAEVKATSKLEELMARRAARGA